MVLQKRCKFYLVPTEGVVILPTESKTRHPRPQECFTGSKYKIETKGDVYQLTITNPKIEDIGKYTIEIMNLQSTAFLNVDGKTITKHYDFPEPTRQ